jgi:CMP/dCMP kinase
VTTTSPAQPPAGSGPLTGLVVAVDGPSGSGKSSVCRAVAARLGLRYLDTGAMYRALTWWALDLRTDLTDQAAVARLAQEIPLEQSTSPLDPTVGVAGVDLTVAIRAPRISESVSAVATNLAVRTELVRRQRRVVEAGDVVAEGRDVTTVVAPDAPVRVLLTASAEARVARRARELHGDDAAAALAATVGQVIDRDARDSTVVDFLTAADGVVHLDSSALDLDQTVAAVLAIVAERAPGATDGAGAR